MGKVATVSLSHYIGVKRKGRTTSKEQRKQLYGRRGYEPITGESAPYPCL